MRVTVLSHNLSLNASMRAHRLAAAAEKFAEVKLVGPVERHKGRWPALPDEPWIRAVETPTKRLRFPEFYDVFRELEAEADGDVLIGVKPHLASFATALVAGERREVPVVLDLDDLDVAFKPRDAWSERPLLAELKKPGSAVYVSLLTRAAGGANAITVASRALQKRFGGSLVPHGAMTETFDPHAVDVDAARRRFGFSAGRIVLFAGRARSHKGVRLLADAVARIPGTRLAVTCAADELVGRDWDAYPIDRIPFVPYTRLPALLAAADVVAVPQLDTEAGRFQMPMKVYDAMAMARPIVATAVSDLPELLDGCGIVVPPGDAESLAAGIEVLLDDPDLAAGA
jgi:glycosyltransferase involved in cell wall biosynthesis